MKSLSLCVFLSLAASLGAHASASGSATALVGSWHGERWSPSDGRKEELTIEVEPILGGAGLTMEIVVSFPSGGTYRGHWVQIVDGDERHWRAQYANGVRRTWVMLEGDGVQFLNVDPGRTRESRLESELLAGNRWRRTQSISEDGGKSWTTLFVDTLERQETGTSADPRQEIEGLFTVDFVESWHQRDAAGLAALWVEDGDWMSVVGSRRIVAGTENVAGVWSVGLQGRETAEHLALAVEIDAVEMLSPSLAQVDLVMTFGSESTGLMREAMVAIVTQADRGWRIVSSRVARIPE